jgi:hypothetical protein
MIRVPTSRIRMVIDIMNTMIRLRIMSAGQVNVNDFW